MIAAGGDPDQLAQMVQRAASRELIQLGFGKAALRAKLLAALQRRARDTGFGTKCESPTRRTDLDAAPAENSSASAQHKTLADVLRTGLCHWRGDALAAALADRACRDAMFEVCPRRGVLVKRFYTSWIAVSASEARMVWALESGMTPTELREGVTSSASWPRIEALRVQAARTIKAKALSGERAIHASYT